MTKRAPEISPGRVAYFIELIAGGVLFGLRLRARRAIKFIPTRQSLYLKPLKEGIIAAAIDVS